MLRYKDMTFTGLPTEGYVCLREFIRTVSDHISFLEKALKTMNPFKSRTAMVKSLLVEARFHLASKKSEMAGQTRPTPIALCVHGPSGIGKSRLLNYFASINAEVRGRKFHPSEIYRRVTTSQYWEGYMPYSHPVIHYAELARKSKNMTMRTGDSQLEEFIELVDSNAFLVDMAFSGKGNTYAIPEMVIADTNNETLHADELYHCPGAYRRRFIFIEPTVLPEFTLADSHEIDVSKSLQSDRHILDKYSFKVHTYSGNIKRILLTNASLADVSCFLRDHIVKTLESDQRVSDQLENITPIYGDDDRKGEDDQRPVFDGILRGDENDGNMDDEKVLQTQSYDIGRNFSDVFTKLREWTRITFVTLLKFILCCSIELACRASQGSSWFKITFSRILVVILAMVCSFLPSFFFCVCLLSCLNERKLFSYAIGSWLDRQHYKFSSRRKRFGRSLRSLFTGEILNEFIVDSCITRTLAILAAGVAAYIAIKKVKNNERVRRFWYGAETQGGAMSKMALDEHPIVERFDAGATVHRIPTFRGDSHWNAMTRNEEKFVQPVHTGDAHSLSRMAQRATRVCSLFIDGIQSITHIIGVSGNFFLINEHSLKGKDKVFMKISTGTNSNSNGSGYVELTLHRDSCVRVTDDVLLASCQGIQFRDISKHFIPSFSEKQVPGFFSTRPVMITTHDCKITVSDKYLDRVSVPRYIEYTTETGPGMCGIPIVMEHGRGACIAGFHFAGGKGNGYGAIIMRDDLADAISKLQEIAVFSIQSQSLDDVEFEEPGRKSLVRFEDIGPITYFGKLPGKVILPSQSNLRKSRLAEYVEGFFQNEVGETEYARYAPPMMRPRTIDGEYVNPFNIAFRKMAVDRRSFETPAIREIIAAFTSRIIQGLEAEGITALSPLTMDEAINGVDHDPFIRRINVSTSAGFGLKGIKADYLPVVEDARRVPNDELLCRCGKMIERYLEGRSCRIVYKGCLKDEPRLIEKARTGKTRVFYASPLDGLILSRMFLSPLYSLMVRFGHVFGTAVGVNMHKDADRIYHQMKDFSPDIIEGDYGGFDLRMPNGVGDAACRIVYEVLKHFGYNDDALAVTRGILTDSLFPCVEILGDVFCVPALQPSGKYATAEDNSLRGVILLMYYWVQGLGRPASEFFDFMLPLTYGDDVLVSSRVPEFNAVSYSRFVEKYYGMTFTTASKGAVENEFISMDEATFLKRRFVYSDDFGMYVAPLPAETFVKSLYWVLPSRSVTESEQMLGAVSSMVFEFAFFRPDLHAKFRSTMITALDIEYGISASHAVKYVFSLEDIIHRVTLPDRLEPESPHVWEPMAGESDVSLDVVTHSDDVEGDGETKSTHTFSSINRLASLEEQEMAQEMKELDAYIQQHPSFARVFRSDRDFVRVLRDPTERVPLEYKHAIERYYDLAATLQRRRFFPGLGVSTQSGDLNSGVLRSDMDEKVENIEDYGGDTTVDRPAGSSSYPLLSQTQLGLDDFFRRPVEVYNASLLVGTYLQTSVPVWDLYTLDPSVRAKLRNYTYMRGKMHVRIAISGSPFHYGRVLFSYQPYPLRNDALTTLLASTLSFSTMRPLLWNYLSQSPGAITLDIKANQPVEMEFPFISPKPAYRLYNSSSLVISDVTSFEDLENAGSLFITTLNNIQSTSLTPSEVRVQIYAWMTDVELGVPTGTQLAITTQSGDLDERETGPLERIASRAVKVSNWLTAIPPISHLAKASSMIFGGLEGIAAHYGWSKPSIIDEPMVVKNQPFQNGSQVIGFDTTLRLTLDPKQELTVDPGVGGIQDDEMVISSIANRTSYLTTFSWAPTDAPFTQIWKSRVAPTLDTISASGDIWRQPTAMAFATYPFSAWSGEIVFRLEFVTSAFHRGKIAVWYEPNIAQTPLIEANLQMNRQNMLVVDLQETQVFEFCVPWARPRQWCVTENSASRLEDYGPSMRTSRPERTNGCIFVAPFTSLQSPDDSTIPVNVYVRAENLRVNFLSDRGMPSARQLRTESGDIGVSVNQDVSCVPLFKRSADLSAASEYHYGEEPISFRALCKRFAVSSTHSIAGAALTNQSIRIRERVFPPNLLPFGATAPTLPVDMFTYLRYAFVAARGGIRKRAHILGDFATRRYHQVKARNYITTSTDTSSVTVLTTPVRATINGTVTFAPASNAGLEFEVPFYSDNLFWFSFADDMVGTNNSGEMLTEWNKLYDFEFDAPDTLPDTVVDFETAAAEDFTFMRFQGAPYYTT
jgi:hypothetical protein